MPTHPLFPLIPTSPSLATHPSTTRYPRHLPPHLFPTHLPLRSPPPDSHALSPGYITYIPLRDSLLTSSSFPAPTGDAIISPPHHPPIPDPPRTIHPPHPHPHPAPPHIANKIPFHPTINPPNPHSKAHSSPPKPPPPSPPQPHPPPPPPPPPKHNHPALHSGFDGLNGKRDRVRATLSEISRSHKSVCLFRSWRRPSAVA